MSLSASFEPDPASVPRARRFAVEAIGLLRIPADAELLQLLVSEVVTNAVIHARSPIDVEIDLTAGERLLVRVCDEGAGIPIVQCPGPWSEHGRGLGLVDATSKRWGVAPAARGKCVWFELDPTGPAPDHADTGELGGHPGLSAR